MHCDLVQISETEYRCKNCSVVWEFPFGVTLPIYAPCNNNCRHLGEPIKTKQCDLCGIKGQEFQVFKCSIHGECSKNRKHSAIKSCLTCKDRE